MSDIYGDLTEHPEFPIEDARRFTVEIKFHEFERPARKRGAGIGRVLGNFCERCGFSRQSPVHPKENA